MPARLGPVHLVFANSSIVSGGRN
ncbi:MAG: hypothetical protein QOI34_787, partial [Verrucomicrobiota bacterium]